jgi:parallel beta helix pectate lyase-like protein
MPAGRRRPRTGRLLTGVLTVAAAGSLLAAFAIAMRPAAAGTAAGTGAGTGAVPLGGPAVTAASSTAIRSAPSVPPAKVCDNHSVLYGPKTAPKGAITVPAGDNENFDFSRSATYWFAPGTHTMGSGEFAQIDPVSGSTFIGAPGAVLNGRHKNHYAFGGSATHVTIENLAIEYFGFDSADNQQQGVVNHDSAAYWTITHSSIAANAGAGLMIGSHNVLSHDCIKQNAQYGFNAYSAAGPVDITITHSEIAGNDTYDYETRHPGCGCSGGGKFWAVNGAVVTSNYVHDNRSVALWADTNNRGFEFEGNYIANNESSGIMYEISYNAVIEWNTFIRNGITGGPKDTGFPTSAIYISESGSDPRVASAYNNRFLIGANVFTENWGGVILWENANRFCGSPDNSSTGDCTLVNSAATTSSCANPDLIPVAPYISDCRWKVQNVMVTNNAFTFNPATVGRSCEQSKNTCGFNGMFSEYGSDPSWSPYMGNLVADNLTYHQNNHFQSNRYYGPWQFMIWEQGTVVSWDGWRAGPYKADAGSAMRSI